MEYFVNAHRRTGAIFLTNLLEAGCVDEAGQRDGFIYPRINVPSVLNGHFDGVTQVSVLRDPVDTVTSTLMYNTFGEATLADVATPGAIDRQFGMVKKFIDLAMGNPSVVVVNFNTMVQNPALVVWNVTGRLLSDEMLALVRTTVAEMKFGAVATLSTQNWPHSMEIEIDTHNSVRRNYYPVAKETLFDEVHAAVANHSSKTKDEALLAYATALNDARVI